MVIASLPAHAEYIPIRPDIITDPTPEHLSVCHDNGCAQMDVIGLQPEHWRTIVSLFTPRAGNAAEERMLIATAIQYLERVVGRLTGTDQDIAGTFEGLGKPGQMDCLDEATNTTSYLLMMQNEKLLTHHVVREPVTRGWFLFGWPHSAASIEETDSGRRFAVDSWFEDNGRLPHIIPMSAWRNGWKPH